MSAVVSEFVATSDEPTALEAISSAPTGSAARSAAVSVPSSTLPPVTAPPPIFPVVTAAEWMSTAFTSPFTMSVENTVFARGEGSGLARDHRRSTGIGRRWPGHGPVRQAERRRRVGGAHGRRLGQRHERPVDHPEAHSTSLDDFIAGNVSSSTKLAITSVDLL